MRALLICVVLLPSPAIAESPWKPLEPGLDFAELEGPKNPIGDGRIRVLRVDPRMLDVELSSAAFSKGAKAQSAKAWCAETGCIAAINASMFLDDNKTSVGLMKTRAHVNHARRSKDNAILALDPDDRAQPPARLIDPSCDDAPAVEKRYGTLVQSIRMISCDRKNRWAPSEKKWSTTAIGVDGAGRLLFIHARSPWPVHALADALIAVPIDLRGAMYTEGGPEAQLYVRAKNFEREFVGSYETGFVENDDNHEGWAIPNVIAVFRRRH